ncbi:hypothetical protein K438DRAFT_526231 [Mycena galopus ATCC 62051]|nr:hypothetical protein K438DRAFT_526231 [Mycena galopus ATCC 62051]
MGSDPSLVAVWLFQNGLHVRSVMTSITVFPPPPPHRPTSAYHGVLRSTLYACLPWYTYVYVRLRRRQIDRDGQPSPTPSYLGLFRYTDLGQAQTGPSSFPCLYRCCLLQNTNSYWFIPHFIGSTSPAALPSAVGGH